MPNNYAKYGSLAGTIIVPQIMSADFAMDQGSSVSGRPDSGWRLAVIYQNKTVASIYSIYNNENLRFRT